LLSTTLLPTIMDAWTILKRLNASWT
jgi:hypothetical protein